MNNNGSFKYSKEQSDFVKANCTLPISELVAAFNLKFNTQKSKTALSAFKKKNGWKTGRTGRFEAGIKPWNTGLKGLPSNGRSVETQFKKGCKPPNQKPIGSERIDSKDGYILIKVEEKDPYTSSNTRYRFKHHVVYEKNFGPISPGEVVRFMDGDKLNCEPDNLFAVSKSVHIALNKKNWLALPEELKPVAKTLTELQVKMFQISKEPA